MKEYCTILFTNSELETAAIVVASYQEGDQTPEVVRHAKHKNREYERAFLLTKDGFLELKFLRHQGNEVLQILQGILGFRNISDWMKGIELYKPKRLEPLR